MGRRRIYLTKDEKQKAQRRWQMEHYWRNSEKIKKKHVNVIEIKKLQ